MEVGVELEGGRGEEGRLAVCMIRVMPRDLMGVDMRVVIRTVHSLMFMTHTGKCQLHKPEQLALYPRTDWGGGMRGMERQTDRD